MTATLVPEAPAVVRVATYGRASTDEANQPYSLLAQAQRLESYVPSQPGWTVVANYVERASGKDIDGRPEMRRLLRDVAAGKFDVVLVMRIDRWSRSLADLLDTVELLSKHGVAFHSATESFDTGTPMGKLLLQMLGMFAEFERSIIIERICRGNAAKVALGLPITSRVGYGLKVDPSNGHIVVDEHTIGIVRRIFREYVNDKVGTRTIANTLNDDGIPGPAKAGWSPDSVSRVLRNRNFVGEVRYRDQWLPGAHPALLDEQIFARAQTLLDARRDDQAAAASSRRDFVLTGTIRCARCDGAYVGTSGTGRNGAVRYYSCTTARRNRSRCDAPNLPAVELEELVTDALLHAYSDSTLFEEAIARRLAEHGDRHEPLTEELTAVQGALAAKEKVLRRYRDDYEAGDLPAKLYNERADELAGELLALRGRADELTEQLQSPDTPNVPAAADLDRLRQMLEQNIRTGSIPVRKALFAALIENIQVHEPDDIRPTFRLYDPADATVLTADACADEADGSDMADDGSRFASRRPGWSQGDSNP